MSNFLKKIDVNLKIKYFKRDHIKKQDFKIKTLETI